MTFRPGWTKLSLQVFVSCALIALLASTTYAQDTLTTGYALDPALQTGTPTFATPESVPMGFVDAGTGNLHLEIPLVSIPQRAGRAFVAKMIYDSHIYRLVDDGSSYSWHPDNAGTMDGWRMVTNTGHIFGQSTVEFDTVPHTCTSGGLTYYWYEYDNYRYNDSNGTIRRFALYFDLNTNPCHTPSTTVTTSGPALDGSGYVMNLDLYGRVLNVIGPDGSILNTGSINYSNNVAGQSGTWQDPNGNYMSPGSGTVVDTLNRTVFQYSGTSDGVGGAWYSFVFPASGAVPGTGTTQTFKMHYHYQQGVSAIQFPANIATYQFSYTAIGGTCSPCFPYGWSVRMDSMTLPTGGTVSFNYTALPWFTGNSAVASVAKTGAGTWSFAYTSGTSVVTRPSGDQTVYTFALDNGTWNTQAKFYNGSATTGTLLKTVQHDYNLGSFTNPINGHSAFVLPIRTTVTWPGPSGNLVTKTEDDYEPPFTYTYQGVSYQGIRSNVLAHREYAFGSGLPGALLRQQCFSYLHYTNSNCNTNPNPSPNAAAAYIAANIINRMTVAQTLDGAGVKVAESLTTYDSTPLTPITGITHHDDTNFGSGYTVRGNPTITQSWTGGTNYLSATNTYDTTGQVVSTTDPKGTVTQFSYADSYYVDAYYGPAAPNPYSPAPSATNAYVTQVTLPVSGTVRYGYYYLSGKQALSTDQNGQTAYTHYGDYLDRPTYTLMPAGGSVNGAYPSPNQRNYSTLNFSGSLTLDGLARPSQSCVGDACGARSYDGAGRVYAISNPQRTGDTSTPAGSINYSYDGLNRVKQTILQANQYVNTYYGAAVGANGGRTSQLCASGTYGLGYPTFTVDWDSAAIPMPNKRQSWTDGLGRLIEVDEPDSTGALTLGTCYRYGTLGNLTQVDQGMQTRTFIYDPLSRLTSETTPEAGTKSYYYTTASNTLCAGDPRALCRVDEVRSPTLTITTTYSYDAENRLTGKTYSNAESAVSYFYDQTVYNGLTITNGKGKRTGMSDSSGQTAWSYDPDGHVRTEQRTIAGATKQLNYLYTSDGKVSRIIYPSGLATDIGYGTQGPVQVLCKTLAYNFADPDSSAPCTGNLWTGFVSNVAYTPHGAVKSALFGAAGYVTGGITLSNTYNNRLQPSNMKVTHMNGTTTVTDLDLTYNFTQTFTYPYACADQDGYPTTCYEYGSYNNGSVISVTNNKTGASGRSQSYTYDELNRLKTAQSTATSGTDCWGQSFTYDRYANMTGITVTQCSAPALSLGINTANNRVTNAGYTYDSGGNVLTDGANTYTWNAEGRMTSAAGVNYTYDADNRRVKKSNGKLYWYGPGGEVLAESDLTGTITSEYIYFNGQRIARKDPSSSNVYYYLADRLGTARVIVSVNLNGTVNTPAIVAESDNYPYGGERVVTADSTNNTYKFTGHERDGETGLTHTLFRQYSSNTGRWLSPDPMRGKPSNPQRWNLYAYVGNDPINHSDSNGMDWDGGCDEWWCNIGPIIIGGIITLADGTQLTTAPILGPDKDWQTQAQREAKVAAWDALIVATLAGNAQRQQSEPAFRYVAYLKVTKDCYQKQFFPGAAKARVRTYQVVDNFSRPYVDGNLVITEHNYVQTGSLIAYGSSWGVDGEGKFPDILSGGGGNVTEYQQFTASNTTSLNAFSNQPVMIQEMNGAMHGTLAITMTNDSVSINGDGGKDIGDC